MAKTVGKEIFQHPVPVFAYDKKAPYHYLSAKQNCTLPNKKVRNRWYQRSESTNGQAKVCHQTDGRQLHPAKFLPWIPAGRAPLPSFGSVGAIQETLYRLYPILFQEIILHPADVPVPQPTNFCKYPSSQFLPE